MTSVSKDASTRLPVRRPAGREPGRFFADVGEALDALAAFSWDLCATSFPLDLERVFRGERDGPACAAAVSGGARVSGGRVEESMSRFFEACCSSCSCSCSDCSQIGEHGLLHGEDERKRHTVGSGSATSILS
jgi:hypothetical protein